MTTEAAGRRARAGKRLIAFDRDEIAGAGYNDMVVMVLTNPENSEDIG